MSNTLPDNRELAPIPIPRIMYDLRSILSADIPERIAFVLALKACGLSNRAIARHEGVDEKQIRLWLKQYDPDGLAEGAVYTRSLVMGMICESITLEAITSLTLAEVKGLAPLDRVKLAERISAIRERVKVAPPAGMAKDADEELNKLRELSEDTERDEDDD